MDAARYADDYQPEEAATAAARQRSAEVGATPVSAAEGRLLRSLAAASGARAAVEVGSGTGVSGLYLVAGLRGDGVLTGLDEEAEHLRLARLAFAEAGVAPARTRLIGGAAMEVLPRLADAVYDLVHVAGGVSDVAAVVEETARLLRDGGVLAVTGALGHGRVADPNARDAAAVGLRAALAAVHDDPRWSVSLLAVGAGALVAVRRGR